MVYIFAIIVGVFAIPAARTPVHATLFFQPISRTRAEIDFYQTNDGRTIADYDVDMTKTVHLIVISDNFRYFLHVHPTLNANGHMTLKLEVPVPGHYHLYADTDPHGLGHQVFRFDVAFGSGRKSSLWLGAPSRIARAGPYTVTLNHSQLIAGATTTLAIHIDKGRQPAQDLHPYLGAMAHVVLISSADLAYVHVHPMAAGMDTMSGMSAESMAPLPVNAHVAPDMAASISVPTAGLWKLWLQFRGGSRLYVASFVIRVVSIGEGYK